MKLTDINSTFYPTAAKYTFFSSAQRILQNRSYAEPQTHLNTFKKFEIMSDVFSNHTQKSIEKQKSRIENWKIHKYGKLTACFLNKEVKKKEIKIILKEMEMEHNIQN